MSKFIKKGADVGSTFRMTKFFVTHVILLLGSLVAVSCASNDDEPAKELNDEGTVVELSFDLESVKDQLIQLDSLESIIVPVTTTIVEGKNEVLTKSDDILPAKGTITNLGNKKTLWKYGVGENLVPKYLCGTNLGQATISTMYKISVRYDLNNDYMIKGFTGEKSGWNGVLLNNSQEKYQGNTGNTDYIEYYTFVYDIISTLDGYTPPGGHYWVPVEQNEARIYAKIVNI
ncbi:MAG: hypothetical protein K2J48_03750 [Muribaculaceae bacterium]|nr:hypothetical protein [Muribaculaceae bacterium]